MTSSDELFSLIKSLSRNEKGYFKKFTGKHVLGNGNLYVEMFDAIDALEKYDEEKIKKEFGKKRSRNFPSEKNYLFRLILRSLNEYYYNTSVDRELRNMLNSVDLLFGKSLYRQCEKILLKAERLAKRYEKFTIQSEIIDWKFRVLMALGKMDNLHNYISEGEKEKKEAIEKYMNLSDYRLLENKMFHLTKTVGYPRTKTEEEKYSKLINEPFLLNNEKALSYWARFHYYNLFNFYYDAVGKKDMLYHYRKQLIDFAETDPEKINDDQIRYLIALNNLVNVQSDLQKEDEMRVTLAKIRSIESKSIDIQIRIFVYSYSVELINNNTAGYFEKNVPLLKDVEEGIKKYEGKMHGEFVLALRYNFFYTFFGVADFSQSLKWMNSILNDSYIAGRKDILAIARIMYLVLHYELGHADLLSYAIDSTKRYFKKQERLFRFEEVMLKFIEKIAPLSRKKEIREEFIGLKKILEELKKDTYESQLITFFDFDAWIESKIEEKSFAQIVKEKVAGQSLSPD